MKQKFQVFTVIFLLLSISPSFGCIDTTSKVKPVSENKPPTQEIEKFIVEGWVTNTHAEYLHTVVGLKTKDGKLLNLIFPGIFMQFGSGMYCRITYHRINDVGYIPEFLRNQKANYFYLDKVELLDNNTKAK